MRAIIRNPVNLILLLTACSFARDDKAMATELLAKAWKTSDIRAEAAPAFRLEATFRITEGAKRETTGRYTEIWISNVKWRREVEAGSSHSVEIGVGASKWSTSSNNSVAPNFYRAMTLLLSGIPHETLEVKGASELQVGGVRAVCVQSKSKWSKKADCINPGTGTFVRRETTDNSGTLTSCDYTNYKKLGDRIFPGLVQCAEGAGKAVELTVSRITPEGTPEESLFVPAADAVETTNCQGRLTAPKLTDDPEPKYPEHHQESQTVGLSVVIGSGGKPQGLRVSYSGGNDFDQPALDAIRHWKFKPALCDGTPVAAEISVQVHFSK